MLLFGDVRVIRHVELLITNVISAIGRDGLSTLSFLIVVLAVNI